MRKIFIVICIASIIIGCVDEKQVAIKKELELIEYDLHFYPQQAEIKLDSIIQNLSPQMKDEFAGQLAFLSGLLEYKKGNIDSSLTLLDKSLTKSLYQNDVKTQAKSQMVLGWIAEGNGFWEQAKINYYTTIQLLNNISYKETGWAYLGIARCKKNIKEPFDEEAEKGIRILKEVGKTELALYADYIYYKFKKDNLGKTQHLNDIANSYQKLNFANNAAAVYNCIANYFVRRNSLDSAQYYIDKALRIYNTNYPGISILPGLMQFKGVTLYLKKDYDSAEKHFLKTLRLYDAQKQLKNKYYAYIYLYRLNKKKGDNNSALSYLNLAFAQYKKTGQKEKQQLARISETTAKVQYLNSAILALKSERKIIILTSIIVIIIIVVLIHKKQQQRKKRILAKTKELQNLFIGMGEKHLKQKRLVSNNNLLNDINKIKEMFKEGFSKNYKETILQFSEYFHALSKIEIQYVVMMALGISPYVIAEIMNVQTGTYRKVKQRIREKIKLDSGINLEEYFRQYLIENI